MKRLLLIIFLLLILIMIILSVVLVGRQTSVTGQASTVRAISLENSYLFASPLIATADNQEKIRITIFLLDSQGVGVSGKTVFLGQNKNLSVEAVQPKTDNLGKAVFDLSAKAAAEYQIEAQVEGQVLPQAVKVTFQ